MNKNSMKSTRGQFWASRPCFNFHPRPPRLQSELKESRGLGLPDEKFDNSSLDDEAGAARGRVAEQV